MSKALQVCRASALAFAAIVALSMPVTAGNGTALTLINGWKNYANTTPKPTAYLIDGIVHLKGAIKTTGSNFAPFVLPAALIPPSPTYVKVTMCNGANGRLDIYASGNVSVEGKAQTLADAQCLTSLDGASYAVSADSFKPLTLKNQWIVYYEPPAVRLVGGVVHFQGNLETGGTSPIPFVLPAKYRPATKVYVPVDLCDAHNGRIVIAADGATTVQAEDDFNEARCFTSFDGAEFAVNATGFTPLALINGWTQDAGTASPAVRRLLKGGIVQLQGAIKGGTAGDAFVLPAPYRPAKVLRVPLDLCGAKSGTRSTLAGR